MRTPLLLLHGIVIRFLLVRGWRWMSIFPLLWLVSLIVWYYQRQQKSGWAIRISAQVVLEEYWVSIARMVFLVGIRQLFQIFGALTWSTWFRLLGMHMLVYLWAILIHKKDLATGAHAGRWVSGALIFWQSTQFGSRWLSMDIVSMMISLSFAMYACIVFVLWTVGVKIDRRIPALLFVFSQLTILVWVIYYADSLTLWTLLWGQIYLGVLYGILQRVAYESKVPAQTNDRESEDLLQVILRGDRVQEKQLRASSSQTSLRDLMIQTGSDVIKKLPDRSFTVLWGLNLLFILTQLSLILSGKTGDAWLRIDIWFWVSMAVYIMNYFVLQKQKISVWWQRAVTFFLVNFGIYLTIYHIFGNVPVYLVGCGIVWSISNAGIMIHLRSSSLRWLLTEKDYQYWLFGNMSAIIANSYFMLLLPMSLQLRVTLIMIYLALQAILLKYQIAPLSKKI